jgi:hypothetical protein
MRMKYASAIATMSTRRAELDMDKFAELAKHVDARDRLGRSTSAGGP